MARNALGYEFYSAAPLSQRPGSVWICLWGLALKISPGINRKSRLSYPEPGFLSSATWPSLPKKHYNGLYQTKPNQPSKLPLLCPRAGHQRLWTPDVHHENEGEHAGACTDYSVQHTALRAQPQMTEDQPAQHGARDAHHWSRQT